MNQAASATLRRRRPQRPAIHAAVYFREAAHVACLHVNLAHTFLLDETYPLKNWHQHVFRKYYNMRALGAAAMLDAGY